MSEDTLPIDQEKRIKTLFQAVGELRQQLGTLARQSWIREQEVNALHFEVHALRLRILELEDEQRKGSENLQP